MRWVAVVCLVLMLTACAFDQLRRAAEPDVAQRMEDDTAPIGPVVELGRGQTVRGEFRYLVWESRMGTCTSVEYAGGSGTTSCGGTLERLQTVELSSSGGGTGGWDVEGRASDDVVELWLEAENGVRSPVSLLSLARAGYDGQVFHAAVEENMRPVRLLGLDADGEVIADVPVDLGPPPR